MLDLELIESAALEAVPPVLAGELSDDALEPSERTENIAFTSFA
ncbi:hypothetical protein [Cryptosporangium phraense]|nr:hypothetical protein [Cryptosporangium phraense]